MITIYIKELEKEDKLDSINKIPKIFQKIVFKVINIMNIILIKEISKNKKIYLIPNITKKNILKNIKTKLKREQTKTQKIQVLLSNNINKYKEELKEFKIVNGNNTYVQSIELILKKILEDNNFELQDIYILTNYYQEQSINIIRKLAPKVKSMNIITKEIQKYRILEEILEKEGILLNIANNKRKSLKKAKIIINLNFSKEELNQYNIFRNSIILNMTQEKINNLKAFDGIIIKDIEIELEDNINFLKENNLINNFRKIELYESIKDIYDNKKDIIIESLYGNNGKIDEKELRNKQKILTN